MVSYFREQRNDKFKSVLDFCCPGNRQKEAICLQEGGCGEKEETCLFLWVKLPWLKAGIVTVGDDTIKKRIHALNDAYTMIFRHRKDESEKAKKKREEYAVENKKTFDIGNLDYITGPHITWSLLNDDFSEEERQVLADALLARLDER